MAPSSLLLLLLDPLYCQEDNAELDDLPDETATTTTTTALAPPPPSTQSDPAGEDLPELFASLRAKERRGGGGGGGAGARAEVAGWAARAAERQGFSALTALLAVDYLDRCFFGGGVSGGGGVMAARGERPWMGRLAAVACLALAAKVEETQVPLLLDLQLGSAEEEEGGEEEEELEEGGRECCPYLFEARTVRRMELLVLSALSWRMNPVTPLSYLHPLLPFFSPKTSAAAARLRRCETVLVSVATDWRWVSYSPSVWAAAALLYTSEEYDQTHRLVALLDAPKDEVQECYQLILQNGGDNGGDGSNYGGGRKRKKLHALFSNHSTPPSPTGVVGSCFSCETSSTTTTTTTTGAGDYSATSSSPEPRPRKRPKTALLQKKDGGVGE